MSKILKTVYATKFKKHIKVKGGEENVSFDYLIKVTQTHIVEEKILLSFLVPISDNFQRVKIKEKCDHIKTPKLHSFPSMSNFKLKTENIN